MTYTAPGIAPHRRAWPVACPGAVTAPTAGTPGRTEPGATGVTR
ncbi:MULTISPECIES: hypothetical protein [unclassified Streptomyces]